ncbi:MAG: hypothetical protein AB7S70_06250, partial [Hyphomicrobium sp.]
DQGGLEAAVAQEQRAAELRQRLAVLAHVIAPFFSGGATGGTDIRPSALGLENAWCSCSRLAFSRAFQRFKEV